MPRRRSGASEDGSAKLSSFVAEAKHRIYATCLAGTFITVVDATAVFLATPTIAEDFGVSLPVAQWVLVGYLMAITAVLVPMGRLSDLIGRKVIYVAGFVLSTIGAFGACLAPSIALLIGARLLMGFGAALVQATSMAIVVTVFPPEERGRVLGGQMGVVGAGTVLGPIFGGFVIAELGWRGIYFIIGIVTAAIALLASKVLVRRSERPTADRFDYTGAALSVGALLAFMLAISSGPRTGWSSALVTGSTATFVVFSIVFLRQQRRAKDPMLNLSLFRSLGFSTGLVATIVAFMGTSSSYFLVPFFVQSVMQLSPSTLGLMLVPAGIVTAVLSPLVGRVSDSFGHHRVAALGVLFVAISTLTLSTIQSGTSATWVIAVMAILSVGLACFHAPNSSAMLTSVRHDDMGVASGIINLARNLGNVLGIAVATAIVAATMGRQGYPANLSAVRDSQDQGLLQSFVDGMGNALSTFSGLCVLVLVITITASRLTKPKR